LRIHSNIRSCSTSITNFSVGRKQRALQPTRGVQDEIDAAEMVGHMHIIDSYAACASGALEEVSAPPPRNGTL